MRDPDEDILQRVLEEVRREVSHTLEDEEQEEDKSAPDPSGKIVSPHIEGEPEIEGELGPALAGEGALSGLSFPATELRDRVTIMLLFVQAVETQHVDRAWKRREQSEQTEGEKSALWRFLVDDPDLDAETIYREAARLYSFEEAQVEKLHALSTMREVSDALEEEVWEQMQALRVIPVDVQNIDERNEARLIFVTHDPMRPSVHRLIEDLDLKHYDLKYAPKRFVEMLLTGMNQSGPTSLLKPEEMGLEARDEYDGPGESDEATAQEGDVSRSTLVDLFETSLVEAIRRGADGLTLYPNASRQVEVLFQMGDHVSRWHVEERVPPEVFLTVAREKIRRRKTFSKSEFQEKRISRWIDGKRERFHVTSRPITNPKDENLLREIEIRRITG